MSPGQTDWECDLSEVGVSQVNVMALKACLSRTLPCTSARLVAPSLSSNWLHARRQSGDASDPEQFLYTKPGLKAKIIDGKKIASAVRAEIAEEV